MANKREFKKDVDAKCASLLDEMMDSYVEADKEGRDKISQAIEMVLTALAKAKNHANLFFDRGPRSFENKKDYINAKEAFFKNLFDKINTELCEDINKAQKVYKSALPQAEVTEVKA